MVPMEIRVTLRSVLAKALISMVPPSPVLGQGSPPLAPGSCTQGQHHTTGGPAYGKKLAAAAATPRSEVRGRRGRYGLVLSLARGEEYPVERRSGMDRRKGKPGLFSRRSRRQKPGRRPGEQVGYVDVYDLRTWLVTVAILT